MKPLLPLAALLSLAFLVTAQAADNMKAFPSAEAGMTRYVLDLPKLDDESTSKVELIVGQTVLLDSANSYFFAGKIEEETIEGWGFPRYLVKKLGPMAGTLMAPDANAPKVSRFVPLGGDPYLVRYNSQLPIVIYIPTGAEVRYRIWTTTPNSKPLTKG